VSIGTAEKVRKFLELNPKIPPSSLYVDDEVEFQAYEAAGFGTLADVSSDDVPPVTVPRLGGAGAWWKYLTNVASLSPVPAQFRFGQIPQGVLRLGGTFVLNGDRVLFAHADKLPGDHPPIPDVLRAAGIDLSSSADDDQGATAAAAAAASSSSSSST